MQLFGFEIKRKQGQELPSVVPPSAIETGSTVVNTGVNAGGYYGMVMDLEGTIKNENDLIRRYREVSQYSDCDGAIEDIVNEAIVADEDRRSVELELDELKVSASIKTKIKEEFDNVLRILKFDERAHELFRSWYIDGRLYYQIIIEEENIKQGIVELRYIDPRKIRRIKNIKKERNKQGVDVVKEIEEYYLYNDKGITEQTTQGVKLALDSVVYCPSGYVDQNTGMMMSYLHKAIKPVNQLKMIEDSLVMYVTDIMNKFRNKIVYDATTGETRDDRRHLSMMEDFWMPRREGGKGTEITTLPGGQNLGEIQDIEYFQQKLYHALNVPISRLQPQQGFSIGRSQEISRDEVKFNKFIVRLRKKFSLLFSNALRVQLIAKCVIRADEWDEIRPFLKYDYLEDNHFSELKDSEILMQRIQSLQAMDPYVGKYYSQAWVRKNILRLDEDDIEQIEKQIANEQEIQLGQAEKAGMLDGAQQAATQNYMMQNTEQPEEQEQQPQEEQQAPEEEQPVQRESAKVKQLKTGTWPN